MGVTIKLNKTTRLMKVYGKDHWPWFVDTFEILLDIGNGDAVELPSEGGSISENSVTRYLQLNKDDEEVCIMNCLLKVEFILFFSYACFIF